MIKAYAEPKGHFVEVKLTNEELSDPLLVFSEIYSILEDIVKQIDNQIGGKTPLSVFCQNMADAANMKKKHMHQLTIYQPTIFSILKIMSELIRNKIMLTAKDIHIGDLLKMTAKYPDDRFNNRYILVKSITKRHYDTVWIEALIINEDINIEYQLYDYMMWFSEESIYRYHKVYNVFELEAKNEHKAV